MRGTCQITGRVVSGDRRGADPVGGDPPRQRHVRSPFTRADVRRNPGTLRERGEYPGLQIQQWRRGYDESCHRRVTTSEEDHTTEVHRHLDS